MVTLLGVTSSSTRAGEDILTLMWRRMYSGAVALHNKKQRSLDNSDFYPKVLHSVQFLTSSAAEDLHTQVEGVSELHRDDAQVARFDQPTEPAGHRGSAYHSHLKHLRHNQQDTST